MGLWQKPNVPPFFPWLPKGKDEELIKRCGDLGNTFLLQFLELFRYSCEFMEWLHWPDVCPEADTLQLPAMTPSWFTPQLSQGRHFPLWRTKISTKMSSHLDWDLKWDPTCSGSLGNVFSRVLKHVHPPLKRHFLIS